VKKENGDDHDTSHNTTVDDEAGKKHKKEKKAKKSKKKNKKKDRDSDSEDEDKENKKKKKKDRKRKDESVGRGDESEEHDEEIADKSMSAEPAKEENDEEKTEAESEMKTAQPDPSKFINSFSEAVVEEKKPVVQLPTLVFNDKTTELAPRHTDTTVTEDASAAADDPGDDLLETGLSKWDKDEFYDETRSVGEAFEQTKLKNGDEGGPQTLLKKALSNMDKDHVREKKRKSLESEPEEKHEEKETKKKKKKKRSSSAEASDEEEDNTKSKKKSKKKKKGNLEIDEKTLKRLLKKNMLKKKALEKILEDGNGGKKKKKKRKSGDLSDPEDKSVDQVNGSSGRSSPDRRQRKRNESEDNREVKSSREGNLQIRVENSGKPVKKLLTSSIEAKISNGSRDTDRRSPVRKSIKDRLGPVGDKSPSGGRRSREKSANKDTSSKRDTIRDRLGRKEPDRGSPSTKDNKLKELPSDLKAWASKTNNSSRDRSRDRRSRSRSRDRKTSTRSSRSRSRERRRSRSRERTRRKRSLSSEKRGKLSTSERSPVKRRK